MNREALRMTTFRKPSSECEQMLEIGCGTGEFTRDVLLPWSKPCRKMVAVNALRGLIQYAKANYPHPDISYEVLDAASRDLSNCLNKHGKFDRVYCFYCLYWIKDQKLALVNVGKLLKDDGECLFLFVSQFIFTTFGKRWHQWSVGGISLGIPQKSSRTPGILSKNQVLKMWRLL
ncbi:unnamed protein product [Ixodes persulcatus]